MAATDALKRAPKWAWFTVGGVGLGALVIRVWQDRGAETEESTDVATVGQPSSGVAPSSPTPVITPPVIIGNDGSGDNGALTQMLTMVGGSFDTLAGAVAGLAAGAQANTDTALGQTGGIANNAVSTIGNLATAILAGGGAAPAPIMVNPTPVYVNVPAAPAPSPAVPTPPPDPCRGEYPFQATTGPRRGMCYKIVLKNGKRYRYYVNGDKILDD
jgi:hypothetical protein